MQALNQDLIGAGTVRRGLIAAGTACALMLGGCGGVDGVDLQGGVFDALGISSAAQEQKAPKETRVAARPGLVLPPAEDRLPQPGGAAPPPEQQLAQGEAWPVNPEENRARVKAENEKKHRDYCDKALRDARVMGRSTETVMGPNGNCQPGMFGSLSGMFEGERKQQ